MRQENTKLVNGVLELYSSLIVPFMQVRRDMPFPGENGRSETDSEHVFTLAIVAISLAERMNLKLDSGKIAKYCLVHDLVEAYAGDVSARDEVNYANKEVNEQKAFQKIKKEFGASYPWIIKTINDYESRQDEESKFVYVIDKCIPALPRMADSGKYWRDYYPEMDGSQFHRVVTRLRKKVEKYPQYLDFFDEIHAELDSRWPEYFKINETLK